MRQPAVSYDWALIVAQLLAAGETLRSIGGAMHLQLTDRMVEHYRRGVQPLHWRGELLLGLWCDRLRKLRDDAPTCEVTRGHRARRDLVPGPRVQSLPAWPPAAPSAVAPLRKKPGPKRKDAAVV